MLHQINLSEKVLSEINKLFKTLKIKHLLRAANIKKACGISVQAVASTVSRQVIFRIASQPRYIQRLFSTFCYES
jgi:hypothetical protein